MAGACRRGSATDVLAGGQQPPYAVDERFDVGLVVRETRADDRPAETVGDAHADRLAVEVPLPSIKVEVKR
jgi:hypothetical protein